MEVKEELEQVNQTGLYFRNINEILIKKANAMFSSIGLTVSQAHVILAINDAPEKLLTQKQLEDRLQVSHPTINGIISRLENNGFVKTEIITKGRLSKNVTLTAKSINICQRFESSKAIMDHILIHNLTESEALILRTLLAKVYNGLTTTIDEDVEYRDFVKKLQQYADENK